MRTHRLRKSLRGRRFFWIAGKVRKIVRWGRSERPNAIEQDGGAACSGTSAPLVGMELGGEAAADPPGRGVIKRRPSHAIPATRQLLSAGCGSCVGVVIAREQNPIIYFFNFLPRWLLRSLTPGPPPFSSMNTTPAVSNARRMARSLATVNDVPSSATSARLIVFTPKVDA